MIESDLKEGGQLPESCGSAYTEIFAYKLHK